MSKSNFSSYARGLELWRGGRVGDAAAAFDEALSEIADGDLLLRCDAAFWAAKVRIEFDLFVAKKISQKTVEKMKAATDAAVGAIGATEMTAATYAFLITFPSRQPVHPLAATLFMNVATGFAESTPWFFVALALLRDQFDKGRVSDFYLRCGGVELASRMSGVNADLALKLLGAFLRLPEGKRAPVMTKAKARRVIEYINNIRVDCGSSETLKNAEEHQHSVERHYRVKKGAVVQRRE